MARYTDNSFTTLSGVDDPAVLGRDVFYGLEMLSPVDGVFMYVDTCTFGNSQESRDVFQPYGCNWELVKGTRFTPYITESSQRQLMSFRAFSFPGRADSVKMKFKCDVRYCINDECPAPTDDLCNARFSTDRIGVADVRD